MLSKMPNGTHRWSAIARPLVVPTRDRYLQTRASSNDAGSPASSSEWGSAGRKASSDKSVASRFSRVSCAVEVDIAWLRQQAGGGSRRVSAGVARPRNFSVRSVWKPSMASVGCNFAIHAGLPISLLKHATVAFFNLARCGAKLRTARRIATCVAILASHPCNDAPRRILQRACYTAAGPVRRRAICPSLGASCLWSPIRRTPPRPPG